MKWFKHDSNAHSDAKLKKLRLKYGVQGYGVYWYCLELVAANVERHNLTFELEHDANIIAHDLNLHADIVQEMMTFMVDLGLFENTHGTITCMTMMARTDEYIAKIIRHCPDIVLTNPRQSPEKLPPNRTDRKEQKSERFKPPTPGEVQEYLDKKGVTEFSGQYFVDFYSATNWHRGKTKIKSWKHCVGTWCKKVNKGENFGLGAI